MVERSPILNVLTHLLLLVAVIVVCFPIYYAIVAATLPLSEVSKIPMPLLPGTEFFTNIGAAWEKGHLGQILFNTFVMATVIMVGKIAISIVSAFAVVYFRFPGRQFCFWLIFFSLMLPVEVRIIPTYEVVSNLLSPFESIAQWLHLPELAQHFGWRMELNVKWSLLDTYSGLTLPLIASATATFLFRQYFLTIPDEITEAAKIDGAGPLRFFWSILLPMSTTNIAALVVILFVYGWNQYLWPLLITTRPELVTAMIGIVRLVPPDTEPPTWNIMMAGAVLTLLPPMIVVIGMQRWFVKGLVDTEK
jgi:sn-glycerol 3-phosphate transport system permease protein